MIIAILAATIYASLRSAQGKAKTAVTALRRHAADYPDLGNDADFAERERVHASLVASELRVSNMDPKFRQRNRQPEQLMELLAQAHRRHALRCTTACNQPPSTAPSSPVKHR